LRMHAQALSHQATIPLRPLKDINVLLMLKVLVGTRSSTSFHVFELEIELPKFAMYASVEPHALPTPESCVTFTWVQCRLYVCLVQCRLYVCLYGCHPRQSPVSPSRGSSAAFMWVSPTPESCAAFMWVSPTPELIVTFTWAACLPKPVPYI